MSFHDLFYEDPFRTIFEETERFVCKKLKAYNDHLEKIDLGKQGKEIFDAVWGNIEFSSGEIYIMDSPLLQRLRRIKQLGLAHYVYCGSDYSRFYHTTGVVYLADRMAASINKSNIRTKEEQEYFKSIVRLAAIFHDVGHMFLSHVSEHYFSKSPLYPRHEEINNMMEKFERCAKKTTSLHELLSCMIVNTTEAKRLLKCVGKRLDGIKIETNNDLEKTVEYISGLIVGVPVDRDILPYSSIINGAIDADKCDYLSRDSHVTRVPVAVDISRLTQKLSVVETKEINMSDLWHNYSDTSKKLYELAMSHSAEKALFQLCIARTIMFDSVYYHHKVLTAETELRDLINELANLNNPIFTSFEEILDYTDNDFNHFFFEKLVLSRTAPDIKKIHIVQQKLDNILDRNIAKRIACIMPDFLEGKQSDRERLFDDVLTNLDSEDESDLLEKICKQYVIINQLLNNDIDSVDKNTFIIQSPNTLYGHSKIQVPINLYNGKSREFRGYELVSSRETSSSASYVVTNVENKHLMYLALEKALYKKYHVILKDESAACGKFDDNLVRKNYMNLFTKGYFNDAPDLVKQPLLCQYIQESQIEEIRKKFALYEGPGGYTVNNREICRFFKQVICACDKKEHCRTIVQGIYKLIKAAIFVDRDFIGRNLISILEKISFTEGKITILPLGGPKDSAKHIAYYFNDVHLAGKTIVIKENLPEILSDDDNGNIIFFDDGSYSGKQLISIMQEYMGLSMEKRTTDEHHVDPLETVLHEKFLNKNIIYCFLLFNVSNQAETEKVLRELGIKNISFAYAKDMSSKIFEQDNIFDSEEQQQLVKEFLRDVGYSVIKSQKSENGVFKEHWSDQRAQDSALGYNSAQQMVILKDSIPTYTITPFWLKGMYHNLNWQPLFLRTNK